MLLKKNKQQPTKQNLQPNKKPSKPKQTKRSKQPKSTQFYWIFRILMILKHITICYYIFTLNLFAIAVKQEFQNFPARKLGVNQLNMLKTTVDTPSGGKIWSAPSI